jgi:pilus assembly protein CpaE
MEPDKLTRPSERGRTATAGDSLSIATLCLDVESASQLKGFLDTTPLAQLAAELQHYLADEQDSVFVDRLKDLRPDICIIDFDRDRERAGQTAERIHETLAETAIFAVSSKSLPDFIIRAMRCGCTEYLTKPVDRDGLLEALARVGGRKKDKREHVVGKVLCFLPAKGGTGATTLAAHLAAHLAQRVPQKALLIDLHPDLGDASIFLALPKHQYHFYDLAENTHRLDAELLQGFVVRHRSGLDVLPAPDGVDTPRHVPVDALQRVLEFLRLQYSFVVVDCPSALDEQTMAVVDQADQVYLIATPELPALRSVARHLEYLGRFDYPPDKLRVVINRYAKSGAIPDAQIEKAIHKNIYWRIPNQYFDVMQSINTGDPLSISPRSELMRSLSDWAETLAGKPSQSAKKEEKGMFGFLSR